MAKYKVSEDLHIEKIENGFVCLAGENVCFLNDSAYEVLMACNNNDITSACNALFDGMYFSDHNIPKEKRMADITETIQILLSGGLLLEG